MIAMILTFVVAIEHLGIMFLEMFGTPQQQAQAFDMPLEYVKQQPARVALANQGIYNGMLGVLLILSFFLFSGLVLATVLRLLLGLIVVVALYGGMTATRKIWLVQLLPAALALLTTFL
ncbi:MAG: DUF1304 domain-containing protein [Limosilactobacillus sp.]